LVFSLLISRFTCKANSTTKAVATSRLFENGNKPAMYFNLLYKNNDVLSNVMYIGSSLIKRNRCDILVNLIGYTTSMDAIAKATACFFVIATPNFKKYHLRIIFMYAVTTGCNANLNRRFAISFVNVFERII